MKSNIKAHIAVLITNILFASNYSLIKIISPKLIGPFAINVVRVGVSLILFWSIWLFGNNESGIEKKDIGRFFLCGLTGVAINQTLFVKGLTLTTTIHAALLMLLSPVIITVFAIWILKERFTTFKAVGLALGIGGSVFLILQRESGQVGANYILGDIFILMNAISYSIFFILVKPLMETYSPIHVIRWVFTIGFILIIPFSWHQIEETNWFNFSWYHLLALGSISVLGTFLAYFLNLYGIQKIGASSTGSYIYTQPVFVVVIAAFLLGEAFTLEKFIAAVFIFAGVYLVSYKKKTSYN